MTSVMLWGLTCAEMVSISIVAWWAHCSALRGVWVTWRRWEWGVIWNMQNMWRLIITAAQQQVALRCYCCDQSWADVTMLSPPWWNYPWHVMSDHEPPAQSFNREEEKFDVTADILSPIKWSADLSMICDHSGPWDKIRACAVMDPG